MALHPRVLADLLDIEVEQARARLGPRAGDLRREGSSLLMTLRPPVGGMWTLRLDGSQYDAEPFDVALVDDAGDVLPLDQWIPGFAHGIHSSLGVPWVCVSGTRAYYAHESHYGERWDAVRYALRADSLLDRLLTKVGL
ncbi:hypothetical protein [Kutzneria kofuensis]|uniref:Uncharacterized protein n=1 Tax=Kutzneria kofuensis TaxID=103725 RepID=A0A7W9NGS6_9PSEU|nr:hypothetical protein [Kutzneria kofuensis]MBB5891864.1 hypothetical protein [Kutzneria kofuensis]